MRPLNIHITADKICEITGTLKWYNKLHFNKMDKRRRLTLTAL